MAFYIIAFILFFIVIIIYYFLMSKSKKIVETSNNINDAMGKYFIILSNFEKIIKEEDIDKKKNMTIDLKEKAKNYISDYPNSPYRADIEKLITKLEDIDNSMQ